ncbi:hypothetical protein DEDE109153_09110 [Deinococcus deserti]|uniref:Uncharacterized protein n=1 Tax=Deinococcus deserti (strain DSM 17065 / CIP 109153 / LMG 22923 / VCD115) TaxID=546414 RepID=C1D453_DEIDV|nr:hypothetical protein [Deinococcus deserti]ACO47934.1 Hypothetical protein Deide_3p00260 [Deinococcus deserti VCD115]
MLVHITLNLNEAEVDAQADSVLEELHRAGVREVDTRYLKSYSLVSGHVDQAHVGSVEALPVVMAVEPISTVNAI